MRKPFGAPRSYLPLHPSWFILIQPCLWSWHVMLQRLALEPCLHIGLPDSHDRPIGSHDLWPRLRGIILNLRKKACLVCLVRSGTMIILWVITSYCILIKSLYLPSQSATSPQASARICQWSLFLSAYEYNLKFRDNLSHANAVALSRVSSETDTHSPWGDFAYGAFLQFSSYSSWHPSCNSEWLPPVKSSSVCP